MTRQTLGIGMGLNLTEAAPKGQMLVWCDLLVPEKDYEVVMQRLTNGGKSCVVQFPREVDPVDFGAERVGDGPDFDFSAVHGYPRPAQPLLY